MSGAPAGENTQVTPGFALGEKIWVRTRSPENSFRVGSDVAARYLGYDAGTGEMQYELLDGRQQHITFSQEVAKTRDTDDEQVLQAFVDRDDLALFTNEELLRAYVRNAPKLGVIMARLLDSLLVVREGFSKDPEFNRLGRKLDAGACIQASDPQIFAELMKTYCGDADSVSTLLAEVARAVGATNYAL